MKINILFLLCVFSISSAFAQKIPENINQLNDKEKVIQLLKLSEDLQYKYIKKATEYAEIALKISQKQSNTNLQADAYLRLAELTWENLEYAKSDKYVLKALSIYEKFEDNLAISKCYQQLGNIHRSLANYAKALDFHFKALRIEEREGNQENVIKAFMNIAGIYFYLDDYEKSIEYDRKALEKAVEINDSILIGRAYGGLAVNYLEAKKYKQALPNYLNAIAYLQVKEKKKNIYLLSQVALVYYYLGDFEKGEEYYQLSFNLLERDEKSIVFLDHYLDRGESFYVQEKYNKALKHYKIGLEMAEKQGNEAFMYDFYERLATTYVKLGDYKEAFQFQEKFMQLKDSIYNKQNANSIAEMQTIYETEEKEKQVFIAEQKNKTQEAELAQERTQKLFLIIVIFFTLFFVVYLFYNNYQRLKKNKLLASQKEELESLGDFKERMTNMIAHDLKNPLNTIITLSNKENAQKNDNESNLLQESGRQILKMVNNMLDVYKFEETKIQLNLGKTNLKNLIKAACDEVKILIRQKNLKIINKIEKDYVLNIDRELLIRVFVNILSNAIKYSPNNANIYFRVEESSENEIKIFIEDEGIGITKIYQKKIFDKFSQVEARKSGVAYSTGLGLTFCKMAIEAHQGQIGVISEKGKGTSFWFTLKYEEINESVQELSKQTKEIFIKEIRSSSIIFEESEKAYLKPYILELKKTALFEVSKITEILEEVRKSDSETIKKWADEIENTLYSNNEKQYKDFISLSE